jgi:hypothetical protein
VIRNNGLSIALSSHLEDSTPERIESSTALRVDAERPESLGNARFERAAFSSGGRRAEVPATLALRARSLWPSERRLPGGLELDLLGLCNTL